MAIMTFYWVIYLTILQEISRSFVDLLGNIATKKQKFWHSKLEILEFLNINQEFRF